MKEDLPARLVDAGLGAEAARGKSVLFEDAGQRLREMRGKVSEVLRFYVPGRIEVLGKHTDYAGGRSLLCAAERGICVVASAREDSILRVVDVVSNREAEFAIAEDSTPPAHWLWYVTTVACRLARNFPGKMGGADIAFGSDLPRAAGMSSSSALIIAMFAALSGVNHLQDRDEFKANIRTTEDLATYLACIENGQSFGTFAGDRGVGTHGGSEDHIAILCCAPGTLSQYSFCPARREQDIAFDGDLAFIIGASGIAADKTGAAKDAYNRASRAAAAILTIWREASHRDDATLFAAINSSSDAAKELREAVMKSKSDNFSSQLLLNRFDQFLLETKDIIPAASSAFARRDWQELGRMVDQSQSAAETLLKNQVSETIELARSARKLGARAASAFGAGFGGSVWALVPTEEAGRFVSFWAETYRRQFPSASESSQFFMTRPGPAMLTL